MKIILAETYGDAIRFCEKHSLLAHDTVLVRDLRSVEGHRFKYEDVIRVPGWSKNQEIEDIEDAILRSHISLSLPSAYGKSGQIEGPFGNV